MVLTLLLSIIRAQERGPFDRREEHRERMRERREEPREPPRRVRDERCDV